MKRHEFSEGVKLIQRHFPGFSVPDDTIGAWFDSLQDMPADRFQRAVRQIVDETDRMYPGTNLVALVRRLVAPSINEATVADYLMRAVDLSRQADGENPYAYLRRIDATGKLCDIADRGGVFARELTAEQLRWACKEAAKAWLEMRTNDRRGFAPVEPVGTDRQLPAPGETTITEEQRQRNLERIRALKNKLAA